MCENGVCYKRPTATNDTEPQSTPTNAPQPSTEEKLKRAAELIEKKRKENEEEEARVSNLAKSSHSIVCSK